MLTAQQELDRFLDKRGVVFAEVMDNVADAVISKDEHKRVKAEKDLARLIQNTVLLMNLNGRRRFMMELDAAKRGNFAALPERTPVNYNVTFEEAFDNIYNRDPRVVPVEFRDNKAEYVSWLYRQYPESKAFAAARSASAKLTGRIQKAVEDLIGKGLPASTTENAILQAAKQESHNWTRNYAATVYRTNSATAYTQGRFEQAQDPDVAEIIPAMRYVAQLDGRTRPNHAAAHGLIAATTDEVWGRLKPPNGYQCRCTVNFVSKFELERRGLWQNGRLVPYFPPAFNRAHRDGPPFEGGMEF